MYNASEKLAIIRLVGDSELSVRRTLAKISTSRSSFYRWCRSFERDGYEGLDNFSRASSQHWNKIPVSIRSQVVEIALEQAELTPRELAWYITDTRDYFIFESSVYHILKAHDLISRAQFVVMSATVRFQNPTHEVHALWRLMIDFQQEFLLLDAHGKPARKVSSVKED